MDLALTPILWETKLKLSWLDGDLMNDFGLGCLDTIATGIQYPTPVKCPG